MPWHRGNKKEHDDFVSKESPSQDVLDSFLTGAGARTKHYEIAAYEGLVTMAEAMGETQVVELLTKNLEQEKVALEKLQTIGKRLAREGAKQQIRAWGYRLEERAAHGGPFPEAGDASAAQLDAASRRSFGSQPAAGGGSFFPRARQRHLVA